jgi:YHS domain-containing protein
MFRAILELIVTIIVVMAARAVLNSFLRGLSKASMGGFQESQQQDRRNPGTAAPPASPTGELHKDPVCGTYVAESTQFRRQTGGQIFYYCSENCREKHALVAR